MTPHEIFVLSTSLLLAGVCVVVALHNICNGRPKRSRP